MTKTNQNQKLSSETGRKKPKMSLLQIFGSVIILGIVLTAGHFYNWF